MNCVTKILVFVKEIPFIRELWLIGNAYADSGDPRGLIRPATLSNYLSRIGYKVFWAAAIIYGSYILNRNYLHLTFSQDLDISELNLSIFPNLLGFGIGIYALIFILDKEFIAWLKATEEKTNISPHILNVDLAFPLIIFALITLISGVTSFFQPVLWLNLLNAFLFIYGLMMLFELIGFIFFTFFKKIRDELKTQEKSSNDGSHP